MSPRKKCAGKKSSLRLTSSEVPLKALDMSWVPQGMDASAACRVDVRVGPYVEFDENGRPDYHVSRDIKWVIDKDTICWIDLINDLDGEEITVTYWDKNVERYAEIASDSSLLDAFDMYWEMRRLPLLVNVSDDPRNRTEPCMDQGSIDGPASTVAGDGQVACTDIVLATQESQVIASKRSKPSKPTKPKEKVDDWGESDEVEYVGVDDEKEKYNDLVSDDEAVDADYDPGSDEDQDDLAVDDEEGCESVAHVTDVDNPKIAVGVTFEDGNCFKRCIRQYAVLKEVELAVPYSESRRYRAYCKAKRCKWRIHASRLPDGRTWQFSTLSKCDYVTNNIAETFNSWIRHEKSLPVVDLMDKIRQMIMERMSVRKRLAVKLTGTILPSVMKSLYARSRDLGYKLYSAHSHLGEIGGTAPPKPKRKRVKKVVLSVQDPVIQVPTATVSTPSRSQASGVTQTSPITRSRARAHNLDVDAPSNKAAGAI
ncbi:Os08g0232800 [Oryza sativa Japonica Group]|uniref:Os08g0232800 protein n=1 Tax=Oryza sativa subsp. japonica TaxID=39947 RepID=C7J692_ORYSJ|nr:Os08g0232800 [Oryza sativa Japonica Group]|eukprot:NP_001175450.1 Os08g0232800 [Oryza sativa Japonica Group]